MKKIVAATFAIAMLSGASFAVAQSVGGSATGGAADTLPGAGGAVTGGAAGGATTTLPGGATGQAGGGAAGGVTAPGGANGGLTAQGGAAAGAGSGSNTNVTVNITAQQQTQVRTAILAVKPAPVANVTFNVAVGTIVPTTVTLQSCPAAVIDLVGQLKVIGCEYFMLSDGRIALVRPDTKTIVLVVSA